VDAVNKIFGDDLREIGALSEIRIELLEKKTVYSLFRSVSLNIDSRPFMRC
jgi:hypothetical protein